MVAQQLPPTPKLPIPKELRVVYPSFTPDGTGCHLLTAKISEESAQIIAAAMQFAIVHAGWSAEQNERIQNLLMVFRFQVPESLQAKADALKAHAQQILEGNANG